MYFYQADHHESPWIHITLQYGKENVDRDDK